MTATAFGDPAAFLCLVPGQSAGFGSFRLSAGECGRGWWALGGCPPHPWFPGIGES